VLVAAALAGAPAPAQAASPSAGYLQRAQNADGGWGGTPGQASSPLVSGWVALGLAAAGYDPADVAKRTSALAYVRGHAGSDVGSLERSILVLATAGRVPRELVSRLASHRRGNGSFAGRVNLTAFAVLALRAAGRSRHDATVRRAARWIAGQENADGGFNFATRGAPSGIDDTGAAIQALAAAGLATRRAADYLVRRQNADGGFPLLQGAGSNAQSTAWAVQGLLAAGRDPARVHPRGGRDGLAYLRSLTASNGEVRYSRTSRQTPVWVTGQALMALARKPLPLARVR
jgi:hypothetical protein